MITPTLLIAIVGTAVVCFAYAFYHQVNAEVPYELYFNTMMHPALLIGITIGLTALTGLPAALPVIAGTVSYLAGLFIGLRFATKKMTEEELEALMQVSEEGIDLKSVSSGMTGGFPSL
jgi:uncharacterized protein YneF (UPF0154 family)